ncbi:MAG TPA: beta-ketoacyl synthase N-terminal-like domain-containing protein [Verrucomicrobiales bacterium]|nr:beta-ketoacyl synthase N-terminal-like domain-containing protein [Verrucomicrobiales bacterium]
MSVSRQSTPREPVAIVGIGCRFPGARHSAAFWDLLTAGECPITRWPRERWERIHRDLPGVPPPYDPQYVPWGGFLDDMEAFDPGFFQISQREASRMDPQQRLLLETAWHTLEDAGALKERQSGSRTGVFIGIGTIGYGVLTHCRPEQDIHSTMGITNCLAANRISYHLNLKGPSIALDTACSSSLVSVHLACRSLAAGECDAALAGGVNVLFLPRVNTNFADTGLVSQDGRCRAFDAAAAGYVRSEGAGLVLLKPLSAALRDGDRVYAVIRGGAVNQDGRSNGLTAPNSHAQREILEAACADAGVPPAWIDVVEAQGTATKLGDPIELHALAAVYGAQRRANHPLLVGSVKTNIGHLESAAGIASLIKVTLALYHRQVPAHLHFSHPNPHVNFARLALRVPLTLAPWPETGRIACAGVSAFGYGGTNAHLILEEAPKMPRGEGLRERPVSVLALSARTPEALSRLAEVCAADLESPSGVSLANYCYTLSSGRGAFRHRLAVVASTCDSMSRMLREILSCPAEHLLDPRPAGASFKTAFVFPGEDSWDSSLCAPLLESSPVFGRMMERCEQALEDRLPVQLRQWIAGGASVPSESRLTASQCRLVAEQLALAEFFSSCGLRPSCVFGFGTGEITAAACAGMLRCEDAIRFTVERGRLLESTLHPPDRSLVIHSDGAALAPLLQPYLEEAAIMAFDSPDQIRIAGSSAATRELETMLSSVGITYAVSSEAAPALRPERVRSLLPRLEELEALLPLDRPRIPMIASVTGDRIPHEGLEPGFWSGQLTAPARIDRALMSLMSEGIETIVSFGFSQAAGGPEPLEATSVPTFHPFQSAGPGGAWKGILECLAQHHRRGAPIDWSAVDAGQHRRRVFAPGYPFQRETCWLPPLPKDDSHNAAFLETVRRLRSDSRLTESQLEVLERLPELVEAPSISGERASSVAPSPSSAPQVQDEAKPSLRLDSTELEALLLDAWKVVLQTPGLQPSSDFFESGGDSLLTTKLLETLRQKIGAEVSVTRLMAHRTPASLAGHLAETVFAQEDQPAPAHAQSLPASVVPISLAGSGTPLFWVHAMGGGSGSGLVRFHGLFDDLSTRMNQDRPFFGLRTSGEPFLTVDEMARAFVADLIEVQPRGPYQLGAYCSSGVVAFEMARILHHEGRAVGALLLIDPPSPAFGADKRFRIADWPARARNFVRWTMDSLFCDPRRLVERLSRIGPRLARKTQRDNPAASPNAASSGIPELGDVLDLSSYPEQALRYAKTHWEAYQAYRPSAYPGFIHLFIPKVQGLLWSNSIRAWRQLTRGGVVIHEIPGNHNSMLVDPHAGALTRAIASCLPVEDKPELHS